MLTRQRFDIDTDTGSQTLTGVGVFGSLVQMGWDVETADTGADLFISLQPGDATDTGDGWNIYADNDCLGTDFLKHLTRSNVHANGSDTGTSGSQSVIAASGDKFVVKVVQGGAAVKGVLYLWTYTG